MKVLMGKKGLTVLVAFAITFFASCSKSDYTSTTQNSVDTSTTRNSDDDTTTVDDFDVVLSYETGAKSFTDAQKRSLADFFFYNTDRATDDSHQWGYVNIADLLDGEGDSYSINSLERAYWNFNTLFDAYGVLDKDDFDFPLFSPAPKDIGSVRNINIQFAFDLDDERDVIKSDRAMLVMEVETTLEDFYAKFSYSMLNLRTSGNMVYVTFADNCGKVFFEGSLSTATQTMSNIKISYLNSKSSYVDASCYYSGALPTHIHSSTRIPSVSPDGLNKDNTNLGASQLFAGMIMRLSEVTE